jgi:hypothetical protein
LENLPCPLIPNVHILLDQHYSQFWNQNARNVVSRSDATEKSVANLPFRKLGLELP